MLNKFVLVVLILQLARAERHAAAQSGPRGLAMKSADEDCAQGLKDAGCKTCTGSGNTQTCTDCTTPGQKVQLDGKSCKANCPDNSAPSANVCVCNEGYSLNSEKTACERSVSTDCAQGLKDAGCKTCTGSGNTQTCTDCTTPGQKVQLDGKSCKANCPDNSAPSANVCVCNEGYSLNSEKTACEPSSTNKSSLSTGAIAGISVAAVVVVGGLVGFLCWWFLCRGKA